MHKVSSNIKITTHIFTVRNITYRYIVESGRLDVMNGDNWVYVGLFKDYNQAFTATYNKCDKFVTLGGMY
jgi:hypothetical protein